ncbi:MAG: TetR/AcrR family transcriptional regulator [Thermoleophilia bacterium]|nr:TetR/AcrR family transcriptional regulator [Thermoleophilia bacterium]
MTPRRGRLPAAERERRRRDILRAARELYVEHGYGATTMAMIARRAGASKETLYAWFGDKEGLTRELIEWGADESASAVAAALDQGDGDPVAALTAYADGLLTLLTGPPSVALNRAAMASPALARVLREAGRQRAGRLVSGYLGRLHRAGVIDAPDAEAAFGLLYGLVVQDTQIGVLLGAPAPSARDRAARARAAVERFMRLVAARPS